MDTDDSFLRRIKVNPDKQKEITHVARLLAKREHYKQPYLSHLRDEYNALKKRFPNVKIMPEARIKGYNSYSNKIREVVEEGYKDIFDIFGNRYIIVSVNGSNEEKEIVPALYEIRNFLAYEYPGINNISERMKDYVAHPKHSSYQSLHITRSYYMHYNAHRGKASHANIYKARIPGITELPNQLEYVFDKKGFCTEVREKTFEKAFEDFFGIPYTPEALDAFKENSIDN